MVYLDNSATTKPCAGAVEAAVQMMTENFGNASSLHGAGVQAMKVLMEARRTVADALGCDSAEIYFTSGGTEANNMAVFGAAQAGRHKGKRIVTTAVEHESVLEPCSELEKAGFEVIRILPDRFGRITAGQIAEAIDQNTVLVSVMHVNNESGAVFPVETIRSAIKRAGAPALLHIDCVQSFGKLPVRVKKLDADLVTVTAHKIHGPKGIGALYIKKGVHIPPRTFGGEQEGKMRPGTESTPLIAAFAAAVKALPDHKKVQKQVQALNEAARRGMEDLGMVINSAPEASPYILNAALEGIRSQTLIQFLSSRGVCVSSGSACARGKRSHVLQAMGLADDRIDSSIRISFSRDNTDEDIAALCAALQEAKAQLARR
ncbi:MAG TPA: cysteine desulfurase [Candidatus Scubalenecus merdavium]|uniref:Cysteine desulfurase n=1 Tax=Candidatus Scybalenecus merdavium TaxID=2840939 RepID=A0A9D1SNT1_9FIRM|nr:cysteine desulfurase [Candidatus Scubalenecus merdavium]